MLEAQEEDNWLIATTRPSLAELLIALNTAVKSGLMTHAEARAKLGLDNKEDNQ